MPNLGHDSAPQVLVLVGEWVKAWVNSGNDGLLGSLVLMAEVKEEHPAGLAVELVLFVLVQTDALAFGARLDDTLLSGGRFLTMGLAQGPNSLSGVAWRGPLRHLSHLWVVSMTTCLGERYCLFWGNV